MHRMHVTRWTFGLACVALLAAGCATTTTEMPPQAAAGLAEIRSGLINGKGAIERTTSAARDMIDRPRPDAGGQINAFSSALAKLNDDAQKTRAAGASAQAQATEYFATWDQKLKELSGQMAEAGQQRRQESMASFAALQESVASLRGDFTPFMSDLQSAEKYLRTDATASGVKAATPTLRTALGREPNVLKKIDAVIVQIDVLRGGK
jgi:hypothetical protein